MNWSMASDKELCMVILETMPEDREFQAAQYELGRRRQYGELEERI